MRGDSLLATAALTGACLLLGAWARPTDQPTNQPTLESRSPLSLPSHCSASAPPFQSCVTDASYKEETGGCEGQDIYYLQFRDADGDEFVDEPDLDVGCTGGHKVCKNSCLFEPESPVHPASPEMRIDYLGEGVYYVEHMVDLQPPSSYCDDPADTCWNDVNVTETMDSWEVPYTCDY